MGSCISYNKKTELYAPSPFPPKKSPNKKKKIGLLLKRQVWGKYIGEEIGRAKCVCCKMTDITQLSFHCGHVIAESNGGELIVENLRPICQSCNSSMGTQNMREYMESHGLEFI